MKRTLRNIWNITTFDKGKIRSQMGHNAKLHKDGVKREAAVTLDEKTDLPL